MDLRHLRYFLAVAEELHFGRAAQRLGISQPPLSQQIQALEDELGVRLFERTKRHVSLTQAGKILAEEARRILTGVDNTLLTVQRAGRGEIGILKLGFTASAPLTSTVPDALYAFRHRYPQVHLELTGGSSRDIVNALLSGRVEIGIIRTFPLPDSILMQEIYREPLMVAMHARHPLARQHPDGLSMQQLADEPFVYFSRNYGTGLYDQLFRLARKANFTPNIVQEAHEVMTIIGLVAAGLGISILPASYQNSRVDAVIYRPLLHGEDAFSGVLLIRRGEETSPQALNFIRLLETQVGIKPPFGKTD